MAMEIYQKYYDELILLGEICCPYEIARVIVRKLELDELCYHFDKNDLEHCIIEVF